MRDTFDRFLDADRAVARGRFGEQTPWREQAPPGAGDVVVRNTVTLDMVNHVDLNRAKAVAVSFGDRARVVWLPRSLITVVDTGPVERKARPGIFDQKVRVTLPEWKAKQERLA